MSTQHNKATGFSLVELMVAMVAGLIVTGAVVAFTLSSLRANTEFVQSARLTQELRNSMDFISRELKRASYDEVAISYVLNPSTATPSPFAPIYVPGTAVVNSGAGTSTISGASCIKYTYDRTGGTAGTVDLANGEIRAIRLMSRTINGVARGVIEMAESTTGVTPICTGDAPTYTSYPATCNTTSGWCPLSDPRQLNVTSLSITMVSTTVATGMLSRDVTITMQGTLISQPNVLRGVQSSVTIRSPCVRTNTSLCDDEPTGT